MAVPHRFFGELLWCSYVALQWDSIVGSFSGCLFNSLLAFAVCVCFISVVHICTDQKEDPGAEFRRFVEKYKDDALNSVAQSEWNLHAFTDLPVETQEKLITSIGDLEDQADLNKLVKNEQLGNHKCSHLALFV